MKEEIAYFPNPKNPLPCFVSMAGISYCDGSYEIHRRNSDTTVLEYVVRGRGVVETEGKRHTAFEGQIYLLRQRQCHDYASDPKDPWVKLWFNFQGDLPEQLIDAYGLGGVTVFDGTGREGAFRALLAEAFSAVPPYEGFFHRCTLFFHQILQELSVQVAVKESMDGEAAKMREYLQGNLFRIVSNGELARVIFRSQDYCVKRFRAAFGVTPYEYQLAEKMSAAKQLLRSTRLSVSEIALRFGYVDAHYFSNLFRSRCGQSPTEYRRG